MGVLDLLCVTTDPEATTFFGFAYAEDYNSTLLGPQYAVLVKSNTNPSSPGDLNWSVVSMFDGSKLNGYPGSVNSVDTSCTINALGVFTMFGRYIPTLALAGTKLPFGIRYNPTGTMDSKVGYNGRGAWSNITIKDGFNWSGPFNRYALGYTNSGVDGMLVHASLSDTNNTITMATLNESTMTLVPMAIWSINATIHGKSIKTLAIGNGHIYTYGPVPNSYSGPTYLTGFPLTTISPATPIGTIYNTTATGLSSRCYYSRRSIVYINHGSLTLICGGSLGQFFFPSALHSIKDLSTSVIVGPAINFEADLINMDYFVPIGPGSGASTFALIRRYKEMYAFGNDNGFRYTHLIKPVNVTDTVRSNPNPSPLPQPTPESELSSLPSSSSSALSAGGITGIAVGVIVVIAGVLFLLVKRYRSRRNRDNTINATADKDQSVPDEDDDISISSEKMADESGRNYSYIEGKYPDSSYAEEQAGSIDILPMAPITPIPEHMQEELRVLQEKMRVVQEQIRASQFSSHLLPNVATTVSKTAKSAAFGVPESEPGSGAITTSRTRTGSSESIPYVPPSCLPESMDLDPSAPTYSRVIAQASSQDSPEVAPQELVESSEAVVPSPVPSFAVDTRL